MKNRFVKAGCLLSVVCILALFAYQHMNRTNIDLVNQAILQSAALENISYDVDEVIESLPEDARKAIIDVIPEHNALDSHTGTWLVTQQYFATKQGVFLSTEWLPEIPEARNLGVATKLLGNVNGVYSYQLKYYWD